MPTSTAAKLCPLSQRHHSTFGLPVAVKIVDAAGRQTDPSKSTERRGWLSLCLKFRGQFISLPLQERYDWPRMAIALITVGLILALVWGLR